MKDGDKIICGSRAIAFHGLRCASDEEQQRLCPEELKEDIDRVLDLIYSVDVADVSFQLGFTKTWQMKLIKKAMGNGKIGTKILTNLANKNPDLKDVYMAKI